MCEQAEINHPLALICAVLFSGVAVLVFNVEPVYLGVMSTHLGFTATELGTIVGVEIGAIGMASVLGVYWIRRVNWRSAMLFGVVVMVAGNTLAIFATDFLSLLLLRAIVGLLGEGVLFSIVNTMFGDTRVPARMFAISLFAQVGLGMLGFLALPSIASDWGYQGVIAAMTLPALVAAGFLYWFPRQGLPQEGLAADAKSSVSIWFGLAAMFLWFVGLSSLWAFVERIGAERGFASGELGQWLAIGLGAGAFISLVVAGVGNRFGRRWQPPFTISLHLLTGLLVASFEAPLLLIFVVLTFTVIWNLGLPYMLDLIAEADVTGRLIVLFVAAQAAGNTAGPVIGGVLADSYGYGVIGYNCAVFCSVALATCLLFIRRLSTESRA